MYSTGDLVTLYDSGLETDRPYLLMKAPLPVAYWPFPITATSSGVSNISRSPINSSKSISARSQSGTPSRSQTTSRCPTFTGTINFVCDVTFHPAPDCQISKRMGVLHVQNGLICEGSGCLENSETVEGFTPAGFKRQENTDLNTGLILVPSLQEGEISDIALMLTQGGGFVNWKHIIVKGEVDPKIWTKLSDRGVQIHIVPKESGKPVLDQVINYVSNTSSIVVVW